MYWAGRTTLVRRIEDVPLYDRAFGAFWLGRRDEGAFLEPEVEHITLLLDDGEDSPGSDEQEGEVEEGNVITVRFSAHEVLRHKDFAAYTRPELDEARKLMADLRLAGALRPSRRYRRSRRAKGRPDLRRTVRSALRSGGEPVRREWLDHDERPRRLVLLCDVSGSMEPYARALMRFLHAAVVGPHEGGGVRPRHSPDPHHAAAELARPRLGPRGRGGRGHRLVRAALDSAKA